MTISVKNQLRKLDSGDHKTTISCAAINGVLRPGALPLLPMAIFLPVIIGAPLLLLSKRVGQVLDAMPASWLVVLQLYRVFGSWALVAGLRGVLSDVFALPAGTGDVLTGLFAVPAAVAVATGTTQGRRAAIIWNIFGLVDFAVAMTLGMITTPGRFQLIVPDVPEQRRRPAEEYAAGHVPGAVSIPVREIRRRLKEIPKAQDIVACCRGPYCVYSYEAVEILRPRGFSVRRLDGGFSEWLAAGLPIERPGAAKRS